MERIEFRHFDRLEVPEEEACAAKARWLNGKVLLPEEFPETRALVQSAGYETIAVDTAEFRKIDGGLSCLPLRYWPCSTRRTDSARRGRALGIAFDDRFPGFRRSDQHPFCPAPAPRRHARSSEAIAKPPSPPAIKILTFRATSNMIPTIIIDI